MPQIRRALVSVSEKSGIVEFARGLHTLGIEILSTGGTSGLLKKNGIPVIEVSEYTGQPEILDGRLKTLHPKIHGGILAIRSNTDHLKAIQQSQIGLIDMVVVNLYPFEETIAKSGVSLETAMENIDIGGPTMIRAAAKNWQDVTVVVDPADYEMVLGELRRNKDMVSQSNHAPMLSAEINFQLAKKVFATMAHYEGAIANYLTGGREGILPQSFHFQGVKVQDLRYGENPHQKAAFYRGEGGSITDAKQLHGKELSFNNILDLDAALTLVSEFSEPAVVIIKHTNPSGVAISPSSPLGEIFIAARECDPLSAFGGIIALNRPVDEKTAKEIGKDFYECVLAPGFSAEALKILEAKKNIRLMELPGNVPTHAHDIKKVSGGFLVQEKDVLSEDIQKGKVVTQRQPTEEEWKALSFAWKVCARVKSNAIVFSIAEEGILRTAGIGCGQMSRIDSTKIGIQKSRTSLKGSVMASDAFFPFRDSVGEAAKVGVSAIIQPGGSLKDEESIQAANERGIAMVCTGVRHFRH